MKKLHESLGELCIGRCPKCGHWTPMIMGFIETRSGTSTLLKSDGGKDRYCMQCDTIFKAGLVEVPIRHKKE